MLKLGSDLVCELEDRTGPHRNIQIFIVFILFVSLKLATKPRRIQ